MFRVNIRSTVYDLIHIAFEMSHILRPVTDVRNKPIRSKRFVGANLDRDWEGFILMN